MRAAIPRSDEADSRQPFLVPGGLDEEMPDRDVSFDDFVVAHVRGLMSTAYLICCDESEAEDLVQECLLRVANRWRRVRAMEMPGAYARRILVNLAIDGGRGQRRRRAELGNAGSPGLESGLAQSDAIDARAEAAFDAITARAPLLDGLRRLSPQQRAVLVLRYFHDLSEAETARVLGCGVGTVKSSGARGLERLRTMVEPEHVPDHGNPSEMPSGRIES